MRLFLAAATFSITGATRKGPYHLLHSIGKAGKSEPSSKSALPSSPFGQSDISPEVAHAHVHQDVSLTTTAAKSSKTKASKATTIRPPILLDNDSGASNPFVASAAASEPTSRPVPSTTTITDPAPAASAHTTDPPNHPPIFSPHVNTSSNDAADPIPVVDDSELTKQQQPSLSPSAYTHHLFGGPAIHDSPSPSSVTSKDSSASSTHNQGLFGPASTEGSTSTTSTTSTTNKEGHDINSDTSNIFDDNAGNNGNVGPSIIVKPSPSSSSITPPPMTNKEESNGNVGPSITVKPSPSSSSITPPPMTNKEESTSFTFPVTLSSSNTTTTSSSWIPSLSPTNSVYSPPPVTTTTTSPTLLVSKELNLPVGGVTSPSSGGQQQNFQGISIILLILACSMVVLGTLFAVIRFRVMNNDQEDNGGGEQEEELGLNPAAAAVTAASDEADVAVVGEHSFIGVVKEEEDSYLQLVTAAGEKKSFE